ncbi:MAG: hypothetical protein AAF824_17895 [Bacteroidota bacterium]
MFEEDRRRIGTFIKMDTRLAILKEEVKHHYPGLTDQEWNTLQVSLTPVAYKKEKIVFPVDEICRHILYVTEGILASEYHSSEKLVISRFFTQNSVCANLVSLLKEEKSNDQLITITEVKGVLIPYEVFMENYLYQDGIGLFFRKKLLHVMLEAKEFVSLKTISDVKHQLAYLRNHYPEVVLNVPWKHIANFMGVTPAWLSRTLKKKQVKEDW